MFSSAIAVNGIGGVPAITLSAPMPPGALTMRKEGNSLFCPISLGLLSKGVFTQSARQQQSKAISRVLDQVATVHRCLDRSLGQTSQSG